MPSSGALCCAFSGPFWPVLTFLASHEYTHETLEALGESNIQNVHSLMPQICQQPRQRAWQLIIDEKLHGILMSA